MTTASKRARPVASKASIPLTLSELATKGHGRKITKIQAHAAIAELATAKPGKSRRENLQADLYSYFMPPIPKVPKTSEQWVAKAVSPNDVRYYLHHANVNKLGFCATDGHRAHIAPTEKAEGFYDKAGNKVECDGRFPDVDRIIPRGRKDVPLEEYTLKQLATKHTNDKILHHVSIHLGEEHTVVLRDYWYEMVAMGGKITVALGGEHDPVLVKNDKGCIGILMPVRL